jgi:signal transduction histidine kinase
LSALAGGLAVATVGLTAIISTPARSAGLAASIAWWSAYAVYAVAFLLDSGLLRHVVRPPRSTIVVSVQAVAGAVCVLAVPSHGWSAVLLVVTVVSVAYTWTTSIAMIVAGVQSALITVAAMLADTPNRDVVAIAAAYATFQLFAVLLVSNERRAVEARTELAATQVELRAANAVIAASTRTAERLRISRELHDVLGHQLTALALQLEIASHDPDPEHVRRARAIIASLLADVRAVVGEMRRPAAPLDVVLAPMVEGLPGLDVDLVVDERRPLGDAEVLAVARCVQEAVTNTLRHAHARHLVISVHSDGRGASVHARDDGRGASEFVPGHGLSGMRERFESLGGSVDFEATPDRGFAIHADLPVTT